MSTYDSYGKSPINALAGSPISISSTAAKGKAELLQLAVNESKGEIQSLRSNVGTLQDTISGHAHTLQLYKNQLRDKDEENRSLAVAVQTLKKEVADARRSADDGDRVQLKYTGVTSKLQQELDEERVRSSRVKQDMDLSIERCDAAERALEDLRRVQAQLTDELARSQEQQRRSNDDLISRETQLQRVASTATQQNEDSQVELRSLRVRSSELEVILQERERELLTLQERAKQQGVEALHGQEELGRLRRQLSESGLQTQTLSERINSSEQIRRQLESEIDGWCNKHDDSQRKSDDLTRQLEDRVCELERLQRAIHGKEDEIEELRERGRHQSSQVGEHEAGIRSLEKQLQERLEHISYTEAKLAGQEKDLSERTSRCDELSRERTAFMQQVEKLNVDLDDSHTEILRIREESNMLREQTRADLEESRRQSSAAKADLSAARGKIAQLEGRVATAEDLRADAQAQLRDSEAQSAQFQARLAEQRRELSEWGAVIVKLQGEKEDAQNATDVLEQERISLSAQVGRLQQKNAEYREELRISRDEVQVLHDATNKREQEIENLQRALEDKHLQLQTLDDKCQQQAQTIGDRMRDIRSLQQQLDDEKNATGTAALEISRLEGRLAAKDEDILSLKEKNSFLKDQMIRLETQVRRLENLPSVIETQEAELVRLRQSLSRAEDEAQNYARSSQTLQQRVSEKEVSCDELQMKINELSIEMQNIIRIRDDLECQVTEKAQEGIRMKGSIARFEGRIDAMDEAYRQSQMKCNAQESEKEALRKQVDASLNEASIMERELNSYRERTGALEISRDTAERQASENSITLIRAKEEMTGAREQAAAVQEEVNKLRQLSHLPAILEHKEAELLRLREAIDVTGKQSDGHVATVRDLSARTSDLEALLNEKDREANDLRRELSRKAQDAEAAMTELATKNNEVIRLRTNLARLDGRLQVMTEATEDEKGKAALLEDELRQIRTGATPSSVMTPRASAVSSTWQRSGSGIKIGLSPRRDRTPSPGLLSSLSQLVKFIIY